MDANSDRERNRLRPVPTFEMRKDSAHDTAKQVIAIDFELVSF